jgi:hypothetical protein
MWNKSGKVCDRALRRRKGPPVKENLVLSFQNRQNLIFQAVHMTRNPSPWRTNVLKNIRTSRGLCVRELNDYVMTNNFKASSFRSFQQRWQAVPGHIVLLGKNVVVRRNTVR